MPIRVLTVGKKRPRGVQLLVDEYIEKLNNYCIVEDVQLRSNPRNARYVIIVLLELTCKFSDSRSNVQSLMIDANLIEGFSFCVSFLHYRDPRAQVDDEDMAVVNLLKPDDWVYLLTFTFFESLHILLLWMCSFIISFFLSDKHVKEN